MGMSGRGSGGLFASCGLVEAAGLLLPLLELLVPLMEVLKLLLEVVLLLLEVLLLAVACKPQRAHTHWPRETRCRRHRALPRGTSVGRRTGEREAKKRKKIKNLCIFGELSLGRFLNSKNMGNMMCGCFAVAAESGWQTLGLGTPRQ